MDIKVIKDLPSDGYLKFAQDHLHIVRKACNMEDLGTIQQGVRILRDWTQRQEYFNKKDHSESFFEKMLVINKGSVERAKSRYEKHCMLKTIWPQYFVPIDFSSFRKDFEIYYSILLRDVTEEGSRVSLSNLYDTKLLTTGSLIRFVQYVVSLCEYCMAHDYPNGFVAILDYRDVNIIDLLGFATRHFTLLQQALTVLTDGYGMRLRAIHVLTKSKATDTLVTFGKQLLSKKLASRLHVHSQIDTLYDFVPRKMLPSELGGYGSSLKDLHGEFIKEIFSEEHIKRLEEAHRVTIDVSMKPKDYFSDDYISISGSFRALTVD